MNDHHTESGYLDRIRGQDGSERCRAVFEEAFQKDRKRAADLLNDPQLTFPCLFLLMPQIASSGLQPALSFRNSVAYGFSRRVLNPEDRTADNGRMSRDEKTRQAFQWMLETGRPEDGLSDDFEEILDITASVLVGTYRDKSILPGIVEMIFSRHKKGHNIHTLVWAVFRFQDPDVLKRIAGHLLSGDRQEATLTCHLLHLDPSEKTAEEYQKQYDEYLQWLEENDPFLYFTEENLQFSSEPVVCRVDLERKYVHKATSAYQKQPVEPSDENEERCLQAFAALGGRDQAALSNYSHKIHSENLSKWKSWMQLPVEEQIKTAKAEEASR